MVRRISRRSAAALAGATTLVVTFLAFSPSPVLGDSGCPTAVAPSLVSGSYEVDTPAKLQWLRESAAVSGAMSNSYKVTADIDMTGCTWTVGIATSGTPFSGTFDGNGRTISNLTINNTFSNTGIALIRYLTGTITDLTLASPSMTGTSNHVAAFVGEVRATATATNLTATNVSVSGGQQSGGAFGRTIAGSTVQNISVSGTVAAASGVGGGIVGSAEGVLSGLTSTVTLTSGWGLGGLAGSVSNDGSIVNSSYSGTITGTDSLGGAAGSMSGTSPNCGNLTGVTTSGDISGTTQLGGLVGWTNCYSIVRSSSSVSITGSSSRVGGLVGYENIGGSITGSYFTGQVQGTEQVGGVAGATRSTITDTYSTGSVTATVATNGGRAGGLVGWLLSGANLTRTYATGQVTAPSSGSPTVGGLIGNYSGGTITASVWNTQTTGRSTSAGSGATGYTTQQMRDYVLYDPDNLNWPITDGISSGNGVSTGTTWSVCSGANSGYPFLTRQGLSGTCRPTMAYVGNGNTGGTAPTDGSTPYNSGDTVTVLDNTGSMTKTSNNFVGWNTKANGTGTVYAAGDTFTITSPVMLFAMWATGPQITYNSNGGTGSIAATTGASGATVTLSSGTGFSRSGFTLSRWDTSAAGTGTPYSKGQTVTMPGGGLMLYAVWTANATTTTAATTTTTISPTSTVVSSTTTVASTTTTNAGQSPSGTTTTLPAQGSPSPSFGGTTTTVVGPSGSSTSSSTPTVPSADRDDTGGAQAGSPTTTAPTTTTTSASAETGTAPDVDGVEPGQTGATVGGQPAVVTVDEEDGSLVVSVAGTRVRYTILSSAGVRRAMTAGSVVALSAGDRIQVGFSGFAEETEAAAWITPDDVLLGEASLSDGTGSLEGVVPEGGTTGERRLVVTGESATGDTVVVAHGVTLAAPDSSGTSWSLVFLVIVGLGVVAGFLIPAARRRRKDEAV